MAGAEIEFTFDEAGRTMGVPPQGPGEARGAGGSSAGRGRSPGPERASARGSPARRSSTTWRRSAPSPSASARSSAARRADKVAAFVLWLILLVLCWPLALIALVLYPIVWLLLLPFRLLGIAVDGVLQLMRAVILLPARLLRGPARQRPSEG